MNLLTRILILSFTFIFGNVTAQNSYKTLEGHIVFIGVVDNKQVMAESHELSIRLDYKTKEVSGRLDLKSLDTGIDSLNKWIRDREEPLLVSLSGVIPVEDFISQSHSPVKFKWPVQVTVANVNYDITFDAVLTHFNGGTAYACLLSASGKMKVSQLSLGDKAIKLTEQLSVQFTQVILRKNEL